jgi:glycosyltransferase involved in cell wall biosynthesis
MSQPLNFLHLTTFYPPYSFGGDAMYLYRLCRALGDLGHHCDVIHSVDAYHLLHPAKPEGRFAEHPQVTTHGLRSRLGGLSPFLTHQTGRPLLQAKKIREVLNSKRYDVIHYHNISLLGPTVLTLEPARGKAVKLYTTHEHWLICPTHVLWKYTGKPCDGADCMKCTVLHKRPPQMWRYTGLLERTARHVDQFVSPSRFTAGMHAERGFARPIDHLPLFVDRVDGDWQHPAPRPHQRPYFLFVGRLERIKGLHTLIALWERVPEYDLLVAGTGTQEMALRAQAAGNPRIRFLGQQSQSQLGPLYYHALACLVPSLTYEVFPMVCLETFARKAPAIVRDLGSLAEVIDDSQGGFVYRTDDELLDIIRCLGSSAVLRAELGENAYQAFLRTWSREAHLRRYFELLGKVAQRKLGRVPWVDERVDPEFAFVAGDEKAAWR